MDAHVAVVILAAYVSLVFELTAIHVPSVASSLNIWAPSRELLATYSPRYRRFLQLSKPVKLLAFVAPLVVVYAVYAYPLLVISIRSDLLDDYLFTPTAVSGITAIALMLVGRSIALVSALTVRKRNRQRAESFELHTSGPFRWSRNPGLVGMYLFMGGIWLAVPSASMLAGIFFYVIYMDFKVRMEEDFLENKFGDRYLHYRLKVGRYLP